MQLTKEFRFEASHILPKHPGKCSRLHGHSWVLHVSIEGVIDKETGFVMDYADLKRAVEPIIEKLDHHHLGTYILSDMGSIIVSGLAPDLYPSSENLLWWIADQIGDKLDKFKPNTPPMVAPGLDEIYRLHYWSHLKLNETCTSVAILTREEYDAVRRRETNVKGVLPARW